MGVALMLLFFASSSHCRGLVRSVCFVAFACHIRLRFASLFLLLPQGIGEGLVFNHSAIESMRKFIYYMLSKGYNVK